MSQYHSTENGHEDNSDTFQAHALWIPMEVMDLLHDQKLTSTEVLLLAVVHGLSRHKGGGCWSSNQTIGNKLGGVSKNHVSDMISHLTEMGLILQMGWKIISTGRIRIIKTCWNDVVTPQTKKGKVSGNLRGGVRKPPGGCPEVSGPSKRIEEEKRNTLSRPLRGTRRSDSPTPDKFGVEPPPSWDGQLVDHMAEELQKRGKLGRSRNYQTWRRSLRSLLQELMELSGGGQRETIRLIREVVEDHLDHLSDPYQPQAYCGDSIRKKWEKLVAAKQRREDRQKEELVDYGDPWDEPNGIYE